MESVFPSLCIIAENIEREIFRRAGELKCTSKSNGAQARRLALRSISEISFKRLFSAVENKCRQIFQ